jgi:serine/threonine protein kinase
MIHGDIKPESILFETELPDSQIKLISFGIKENISPLYARVKKLNNVCREFAFLVIFSRFVIWLQRFCRGI